MSRAPVISTGTGDADAAGDAPAGLGALRERLREAAEAFAGPGDAVPEILTGMVEDVDRALAEELEIFPVCHHSPASALAMARRLAEKRPRVIYLELPEDLAPLLDELRNCQLPVALQAFATEVDGFPTDWAPLSVVAPLTEASAEYQAIAYALDTPGVELVLVDRSADHVLQWRERGNAPDAEPSEAGEPSGTARAAEAGEVPDEAALHGDALGIGVGRLRPGFAELEAFLLHHGKVRHWSEWWDQYVERPLAGADYPTYRQVMVMIGSLFRRLRPERRSRLAVDEDRERYMWTRIREHLAASGADPAECLHVCGAFHAASRVEQFGLASRAEPFPIPPRTATAWRYGLIPSSNSAIEAQFGLAPGAVSLAAATWSRTLTGERLTPFRLTNQRPGSKGKGRQPARRAAGAPAASGGPGPDRLTPFLDRPPVPHALDEDELRGWCVDLVRLARRNGYAASTADAIAVFETSVLLAGMRGRARPTAYDFEDAAVTCVEKDTVPGKRDVRRLCAMLLGGDRIGTVGYDALPPLARDVLDRLAPLGLNLTTRSQQRALLDLANHPELRPCSDVLWMLRRLLGDVVRPVMGDRTLGERSIQESWDLALGREQRALVQLGYEGVTVEQVLERRLRRAVRQPNATAATALEAVEEALLYLGPGRLVDDLGARAVALLAAERTVDDAPRVLRRIRRLLGYYRTTEAGPPDWAKIFVTTGYAHYCTLLPSAFTDEAVGARQVGAMLGFLFGLEGFAVSLGCDRTQLELAVRQSHPSEPDRTALLWAAEHRLDLLPLPGLRERCAALLANPLVVPAFPRYVSGFVQALDPVPTLTPFVVEQLSRAFARLPEAVLLPWLPRLIMTLREEAAELLPLLVREAGRTFPGTLAGVDGLVPPWEERPAAAPPAPPTAGPAAELLAHHPATTDALAALLGAAGEWAPAQGQAPAPGPAADLVAQHPATAEALAALLTPG
ncbi:DUF5682 family protein [Streptomyces triticirhizae]|uniref:Uncharacterized protein n=1 Tax=Streptomyces triticirhizae TaxID=2483353 RepID=A0A3M2MBR3_9ACTN|nr:DUF5682 family protein [Streptomyces triticirhizae]RMI44628.1 hypothetical protein EBN88_04850 [Streptomyces triticirhizae]